ncbi:MAG: hypothetical protein U0359_39210 [Byssovorax sp.]
MCSDGARARRPARAIATIAAALLLGCTSPHVTPPEGASTAPLAPATTKKDPPMSDQHPHPDKLSITLTAGGAGWQSGPLVPEQGAMFQVHLRNDDAVPHKVASLDDHPEMLLSRIYDASGALVREGMPGVGPGHHHEPRAREVSEQEIAPAGELSVMLNLWEHGDPLGPGRYTVEVEQRGPVTAPIISGRVPFEIAEASIDACAIGFDSPSHLSSILAWIAARKGAPSPELLVRQSAVSNHLMVNEGGFSHGPVKAGSRLAMSRIAPGGRGAYLGWVGVTSPGSPATVELFRYNNAHPQWKSGPIAFPLDDVQPVPSFPDRGHAVFLATGSQGGHAYLGGVVVTENAPLPRPFAIPLTALPSRTACAFGPSGPISVLYATDDGASTHIVRIDLDESGAVLAAEQVLRTTPNRVAAIAADLRPGAPPMFVVLEQNRTVPNRLAVVRLPLAGAAPPILPFAPLAGWPEVVEQGNTRPLRAGAIAFDLGLDGAPELAIVDERGQLFAGRLDGASAFVHHDTMGRAHCPHVAALSEHDTYGSFTDVGLLDRTGGH